MLSTLYSNNIVRIMNRFIHLKYLRPSNGLNLIIELIRLRSLAKVNEVIYKAIVESQQKLCLGTHCV